MMHLNKQIIFDWSYFIICQQCTVQSDMGLHGSHFLTLQIGLFLKILTNKTTRWLAKNKIAILLCLPKRENFILCSFLI